MSDANIQIPTAAPQEAPPETLKLPDSPEQPPIEAGADDFLNMVRENNATKAGEELDVQEPKQEEEKVEKEENQEGILADPVQAAPQKKSKAENIKSLRTSLQAERDRIQTLEAELETYKQRAENPELPEDIKNDLKAKEERIEALTKYEQMFGLYNTEGFKEKFYDSVDELKVQATTIADDYDVDHNVIDHVMGITNRKQLIDTLSQYFDIHTAGEVRDIVLQSQGIIAEREKAEKNPEEVRQQLLSMVGKKNEQKVVQAREQMTTAAGVGWARTVEMYSDPNTGLEPLKIKQGDTQHNERRDAILESAKTELSTVLGIFASQGLTGITDELATALSARFQLSAVTAAMHKDLQDHKKQVQELMEQAEKNTKYTRPLRAGRSTSGSSQGTSTGEIPREKLSEHVFAKALQAEIPK